MKLALPVRCRPLTLAGGQGAIETTGILDALVEVLEDLWVSLGDCVADKRIVTAPGVPIHLRIWR